MNERIVYRDRRTGISVMENPLLNPQLGINPLVSAFVIGTGALTDQELPGDKLFPPLSVSAYTYKVPKVGTEHQVPVNTLRAYGARMKVVRRALGYETRTLNRHTLAGIMDEDEPIGNVLPIDLPGQARLLARRQLLMGLEVDKAELVEDDANFGLVITVVAGNGWNQVGSALLDDITVAKNYLEDTIGIESTAFKVALFNKARQAARLSEALRAQLVYTKGAVLPGFSDVAQFLDVGEVWGSVKKYKPTYEAPTQDLYPEAAIVYYPGEAGRQGSFDEGDRPWGRTATLGDGVALSDFYNPERTTWMYPFQKREATDIWYPESAVKIETPWQEA